MEGWVLIRSRSAQDLEDSRFGRWLLRIARTTWKRDT